MPFKNPSETPKQLQETKSEAAERLKAQEKSLALTVENLKLEIEVLETDKSTYDNVQENIAKAKTELEEVQVRVSEHKVKEQTALDATTEAKNKLYETQTDLILFAESTLDAEHDEKIFRTNFTRMKEEASAFEIGFQERQAVLNGVNTEIEEKTAKIAKMEAKAALLESKCTQYDEKMEELGALEERLTNIRTEIEVENKHLEAIRNNALTKEQKASAIIQDALERAELITKGAEKEAKERKSELDAREGQVTAREAVFKKKVAEVHAYVEKARQHFGIPFENLKLPEINQE